MTSREPMREGARRGRAGAWVMLGTVAAACTPVGSPPGSADPVPAPATVPSTVPSASGSAAIPCPAGRLQTVLDAVNLARRDRGLAPVRPEARLTAAARAHARDLARTGRRGHDGSDGSSPADRATRAGYPWVLVGENVATGGIGPSAAVSGWMDSPPHRDNLLTPEFREVGLAWEEGHPAVGPVWVLVLGRREGDVEGPAACADEIAGGEG